ncbi:MAG TPA: hypothetical protein VFB45_23970 [Pseudolabrys sp.]|nr:hypothetical protein [Pseudolabrys sp.]
MAKAPTKQLVVCIENESYPAALEKRKIYVALRDTAAEKVRAIPDHRRIRRRLPVPEGALPPDRIAAVREKGSARGGLSRNIR